MVVYTIKNSIKEDNVGFCKERECSLIVLVITSAHPRPVLEVHILILSITHAITNQIIIMLDFPHWAVIIPFNGLNIIPLISRCVMHVFLLIRIEYSMTVASILFCLLNLVPQAGTLILYCTWFGCSVIVSNYSSCFRMIVIIQYQHDGYSFAYDYWKLPCMHKSLGSSDDKKMAFYVICNKTLY